MVVRNAAGVHVPVRPRMEERRIHGRNPVCGDYPNCDQGDNCSNAHGKEESQYWSGVSYNIMPHMAAILCLIS